MWVLIEGVEEFLFGILKMVDWRENLLNVVELFIWMFSEIKVCFSCFYMMNEFVFNIFL